MAFKFSLTRSKILLGACILSLFVAITEGNCQTKVSGPVIPRDSDTRLCTTASFFLAGIFNEEAASEQVDCIIENLSKSQVTSKFASIYLQMAYLSDAAYSNGGKLFEINWIEIDSYTSQRTGLNAKVFRNINDSSVVVAFAGTELNSSDLNADVSQYLLGIKAAEELSTAPDRDKIKEILKKYTERLTPQYKDALDYVKQMIKKYGNVKLTGHSLGGGLAQYVAAKLNLTAVTFNPAGLSGAYLDLLQSCDGKKGCGKDITNVIAFSENLTSEGIKGFRQRMLLGDKDHVSGLGILIGNNIKLIVASNNVNTAYDLHKLSNCIKTLEILATATKETPNNKKSVFTNADKGSDTCITPLKILKLLDSNGYTYIETSDKLNNYVYLSVMYDPKLKKGDLLDCSSIVNDPFKGFKSSKLNTTFSNIYFIPKVVAYDPNKLKTVRNNKSQKGRDSTTVVKGGTTCNLKAKVINITKTSRFGYVEAMDVDKNKINFRVDDGAPYVEIGDKISCGRGNPIYDLDVPELGKRFEVIYSINHVKRFKK